MKIHFACIAMLIAVSASAASISDVYVIPAAAHAVGATGELWQSDVSFFNPDSTPLTLDLALVGPSGNSSTIGTTLTLAPHATQLVSDVIGSAGGSGAIIVSGNHPFVAMSRARASSARGNFAESVFPAAEFFDATSRDSFITGLASNSASRTNVGFFAAADRGAPMTITITLLGADGTQLGTPQSFTVPAGGMMQTQISVRALTSSSFDNATARVSITGGSGVATAYGSVIANDSGDGAFIAGSSGAMPPSSAAAALRAHFGW
jgi:hypothetical protein